ncbi:lipid II flippase MurJ [Granulicella cerasi]|uniref:Lipid II flippase MurJ n=1 Tax=Granulicella cerasi TaxID=741063 RepID=A0ABW1ZAC4_9BACT
MYSLPVGVLMGVLAGPGLLNMYMAFRTGLRYKFGWTVNHPAFREWLRLNLPLMLGFTIGQSDKWILGYFASADLGGISRLTVAKSLFNAPLNIVGAAAGAASLPFFASLHAKGKAWDFSTSVSRSVSRLLAFGALLGAWMIALAPWLLDLFRGGSFHRTDAAETTQYFTIFSLTVGIWAAQGIYARAFYAAGNARTPLVAGSLITVLSLPIYKLLFVSQGTIGLPIASDIGMTAYTVALAVLLHKRRLVSIAHLEWGELLRSVAAGGGALAAAYFAAHALPVTRTHSGDIVVVAVGSVAWFVAGFGMLILTGSKLPRQLLRRGKA